MVTKLPNNIKILGNTYKVIYQSVSKTGNDTFGGHGGMYRTIWINTTLSHQCQESTILHEIIEAINFHLNLELKHKTINQLEAALYQVLKDNKLEFK